MVDVTQCDHPCNDDAFTDVKEGVVKRVDKYLLDGARNALDSCISAGKNSSRGINVDYLGACVQINDYKDCFVVDTFEDMLNVCCNINRWECLFDHLGTEKCTDVLSKVTKKITVKIADITIPDFDPSSNPFTTNKDYERLAGCCTVTCPDVPESCGKKFDCKS